MSGIARSTLNPEPQPLALPILLGVILHLTAGFALMCASLFAGPSEPLFDPNDAMEVSMMVLPKSKSSMPERAQRAARPIGEVAPPEKPVEEPPPKSSDLVKFEKDAPAKAEGVKPKDLTKDREDAMRKMLLDDIEDAPEGPTDRDASDPNSTSDEAINATGSGKPTDPELARYIAGLQKLFDAGFNPLPSITAANPDLQAKIRVMVDDQGTVTGYDWVKQSGNESFDRAAETAVQRVSKIPLPPEKYLDQMSGGYVIVFEK